MKSGSLNFQEPSRPVQACNGIALPFFLLDEVSNQLHATPALLWQRTPVSIEQEAVWAFQLVQTFRRSDNLMSLQSTDYPNPTPNFRNITQLTQTTYKCYVVPFKLRKTTRSSSGDRRYPGRLRRIIIQSRQFAVLWSRSLCAGTFNPAGRPAWRGIYSPLTRELPGSRSRGVQKMKPTNPSEIIHS
jgi:hypothetical protein